VGFFIRIEAKPGREAEVEAKLKAALAGVEQEPATTVWLALRLGPSTFAVVDAFPDEAGRQAHLEAGRARLARATGALRSATHDREHRHHCRQDPLSFDRMTAPSPMSRH
jgi:quinol monooxygenase YgiN